MPRFHALISWIIYLRTVKLTFGEIPMGTANPLKVASCVQVSPNRSLPHETIETGQLSAVFSLLANELMSFPFNRLRY
jgi:hypothetical protein